MWRRDSRKLIVPLASPFTRSLKPVIVHPIVLERLELLLQANEVVEPCELDRHVEGRGVVEEFRKVDGTCELVGLACALDELDNFLVEVELASGDVIGSELFAKGITEDVEGHALACETGIEVSWCA